MFQQAIQQRGLAAAEKAGEERDGCDGGGSHNNTRRLNTVRSTITPVRPEPVEGLQKATGGSTSSPRTAEHTVFGAIMHSVRNDHVQPSQFQTVEIPSAI